jgi:hypothetical protein
MAALYAGHMNRVDRDMDGPDADAGLHPAPPADPDRQR